jgi:DNA polymerase-3 subunit alpha
VDKKQINRRTIESLIRAGAFDCFKVDRAMLLASVGLAMESAEQAEKSANQVSLFGGDDSDLEAPLEYAGARLERQAAPDRREGRAGLLPVRPPVLGLRKEVRRFVRTKIASLEPRASRAAWPA